jgi:hypothetical protein
MCESCKELAAMSRSLQQNPRGNNRHTPHTRKRGLRCEYPETCTCQHRKIADGFVPKEERES